MIFRSNKLNEIKISHTIVNKIGRKFYYRNTMKDEEIKR